MEVEVRLKSGIPHFRQLEVSEKKKNFFPSFQTYSPNMLNKNFFDFCRIKLIPLAAYHQMYFRWDGLMVQTKYVALELVD